MTKNISKIFLKILLLSLPKITVFFFEHIAFIITKNINKLFLEILLLSLPKIPTKYFKNIAFYQKYHHFLEIWLLSSPKIIPKCFLTILLLSSYSSSSLLSLSLTMALSSAGRQILSAGDDDPSIADINVSIIVSIMSSSLSSSPSSP